MLKKCKSLLDEGVYFFGYNLEELDYNIFTEFQNYPIIVFKIEIESNEMDSKIIK